MAGDRPTRIWPYFLACAALAAWLVPTSINHLHGADSVLFQLQSRYYWMPFLWEQDRVGMLWPLLMKPIEHPLANLHTHTGITIFCGLAWPFVLIRYLLPTFKHAGAAASLGSAWLMFAAPDLIQENVYVVCYYVSALFLGGCGLLALEPRHGALTPSRICVGVVFLLVAHWVYIAAVLVLLPLAILRLWCHREATHRAGLYAIVGSFVAGFVLMHSVRGHYPGIEVTPTQLNAVATIPGHADLFRRHLLRPHEWPTWVTGLAMIYAVGGLLCFVRRTHVPEHFGRVVATLAAVGASEWLAVSSLAWPCANDHHPRYVLYGLIAVHTLSGLLIVATFPRLCTRRSLAFGCLVLFVAIVARHGLPSLAAVRADFDTRFGQNTDAYLASRADAISDDYMNLWTAFFHLELVRYEHGLPPLKNVVGVRTAAFFPEWARHGPAGFTVATPKSVPHFTEIAGLKRGLAHLVPIRDDGPVAIFRTRFVFAPYPGKPPELP
jgi:hypothetical protein